MATSRRRLVPLLVLGLATTSWACAAIFGLDDLSDANYRTDAGVPVVDGTAPVDGTTPSDAGADATDPRCARLSLPDKPTVSGSAATPGDVYAALKRLRLGTTEGDPVIGFNLDKRCTDERTQTSCITKGRDGVELVPRDKDGSAGPGIDNAGTSLLSLLAGFGGAFSQSGIDDLVANGELGIVFRVINWNQEPNDSDVTLEIFPAFRATGLDDGGVRVPKPQFGRGDIWTLDDRYQAVETHSTLKSTPGAAYVSNGVLVAHFDKLVIPLKAPDDERPLDLIVKEGIFSGPIVKEASGYKVTGTFAGRMRTVDFLDQVRLVHVQDSLGILNAGVCDPPNGEQHAYGLLKSTICSARDIMSASILDNQNQSCDSLSVGLLIETYGIDHENEISDFASRPTPVPAVDQRCTLAGAIKAGDDCAK